MKLVVDLLTVKWGCGSLPIRVWLLVAACMPALSCEKL